MNGRTTGDPGMHYFGKYNTPNPKTANPSLLNLFLFFFLLQISRQLEQDQSKIILAIKTDLFTRTMMV